MQNINVLKFTRIMIASSVISIGIAQANTNLDENLNNNYQTIQNDTNKNDVKKLIIENDNIITQQIRSSIALEPKLNGVDVTVNTKNGIVTLSGKIYSSQQNKLIIYIIESIEGIRSVNNNLQIINKETASQYIEDTSITTKIKAKLLNDNITSGLHIKVKTIRGVVYLKGTVKNLIQLKNAEKIAKNTSGVKKVHNKIIVK